MNCTTESKNCQKRGNEAMESERGDAHFMNGELRQVAGVFSANATISGETDNPFILLRLGENYLEMEDETNATEFLLRAYMLEGKKIFKEDWKYFQWLSGHVNLKQNNNKIIRHS